MSTPLTSIEVRAPHEQAEGTRSQILRWMKAVGESVVEHEPLIEIETDKVTVEVPSPASGVLREIIRQEQDEIAPGQTLGRIELTASAAAVPTHSSSSAAAPQAAPVAAAPAAALRARNVGGLSPAVKRLLEQRGLTAHSVEGTGPAGKITVDDVLRTPHGEPATGVSGASHHVTHSPMRRRIAQRMVYSLLHTAPHVTTMFEADFSAVLAHRERHRAQFEAQGTALTLTVYILAACVDAIRAVPEVNARWHDDSLELFDSVDIGIGTAVEGKGLIVPVVRAVHTLPLLELSRQLGSVVKRAREDRLTPADVHGGTFTISNHGVSGSLVAAPIVINQPQVAILGVGKLEKRAVVIEQGGSEQIVVRPRCYITLTIDHRVLDGHRANRFLQVLVDRLEHWPHTDP